MKRKTDIPRKYIPDNAKMIKKEYPNMYISLWCTTEEICVGFSSKPMDRVLKKSKGNSLHYKSDIGNRFYPCFMVWRDGYEQNLMNFSVSDSTIKCVRCGGLLKVKPIVSHTVPVLQEIKNKEKKPTTKWLKIDNK